MGGITNKRFFGIVVADIDDADRQVDLSFAPRGKDPLDDGHLDRCLSWALASLADLKAKGYVFQLPSAAQN